MQHIKNEFNMIQAKLKEENQKNDVKMMKAMKDIPMFCSEVIFINQIQKKLDRLTEKLKTIMLDQTDKMPESKELMEMITNLKGKLRIKEI